jgi:adiponectin receptor
LGQITVSGSVTAIMISVPRFRRWRTARTYAYVALGASSLIPMIHGVQLYGLKYMLKYSGMKWYLLELTFYGYGVGMYAVCLQACSLLYLLFSRMT